MDVKQLIQELQKYNQDKIVVLSDGVGWDNVGEIREDLSTISILPSKNIPFSSDN